jgi:murein DD-endopeptidase MepM/ murein hydrolase activator NlpD
MDDGAVTVVAAAGGTIISKTDGNFDRQCSSVTDNPNYIFVQHSDGTVAWYLHMKSGSVTTKTVGQTVVAGEVLGKVGSSGFSSAPHLHFELHSTATAGSPVIDPFTGACNTVPTSWAAQRAYEDPAINRLATHSAPPVFGTCPTTADTPNFKTHFQSGESVLLAAYYREQRQGQIAQFRILRPDQSVFQSWSFDSASVSGSAPFYSTSYWYWTYNLPAGAPDGMWTFESTYQTGVRKVRFFVGDALFADGAENQ